MVRRITSLALLACLGVAVQAADNITFNSVYGQGITMQTQISPGVWVPTNPTGFGCGLMNFTDNSGVAPLLGTMSFTAVCSDTLNDIGWNSSWNSTIVDVTTLAANTAPEYENYVAGQMRAAAILQHFGPGFLSADADVAALPVGWNPTNAVDAAGLQLAIWAAVYNGGPVFSDAGNLKISGDGGYLAQAQQYYSLMTDATLTGDSSVAYISREYDATTGKLVYGQAQLSPYVGGPPVGPGNPTPEPFTLTLCAAGLGLAAFRRRLSK